LSPAPSWQVLVCLDLLAQKTILQATNERTLPVVHAPETSVKSVFLAITAAVRTTVLEDSDQGPVSQGQNEYSRVLSRQLLRQFAKQFPRQKKTYSKRFPRQKKTYSKRFPRQKKTYSKRFPRQKKTYSKRSPRQKKTYSKRYP
jgi:hypothetical protein